VRVIAGSYGGRRLKAPPGRATRPTSDRVKEALFSMLGELDGARVMDVFAGSGSLGIEALSRGAGMAVFVERDARATRVLGENLAALALPGEVAEVRRGDALAVLRRAREARETYDLLLVDPPYDQAPELEDALAAIVPSLLAPRGRVAVESGRRAPLDLGLEVERQKRYGDTSITIHRHR
jgi:16S rRNA (guanine966-N2)-methyltransferase